MTNQERIDVLKLELAEADARISKLENEYEDGGSMRALTRAILDRGQTVRAMYELGWRPTVETQV